MSRRSAQEGRGREPRAGRQGGGRRDVQSRRRGAAFVLGGGGGGGFGALNPEPYKPYKNPINPINPVNPINPISPISPISPINPKAPRCLRLLDSGGLRESLVVSMFVLVSRLWGFSQGLSESCRCKFGAKPTAQHHTPSAPNRHQFLNI